MSKQTISERVIKFLTEYYHAKEVNSKSTKYRCFKTPKEATHFYWVGRHGAVRAGQTISNSVSLTDVIRGRMKVWERQNEI